MTYENNFEYNGFSENAIASLVAELDDTRENISYEDLIICKIDKTDRTDFESRTGKSIIEAAKKVVLSNSADGSLKSGLDTLTAQSKLHDGADLVGWILAKKTYI